MGTFDEKRRAPRVPTDFSLKYKELQGNAEDFRGTVSKNISEGGVRFRSDRFISLACRLIVELNLPALAKPVRAVSKIAWIKKLPVGDDYEVGNKFLEISREDKGHIKKYVDVNQENIHT